METFRFDVLVIGTGAAGYHAACRIKQENQKSVAIITEGVNIGTSRNTGSDKQTYYKLGLAGSNSDSVRKMAENLFHGGSVDGDNALCEAALSARCFFHLCELGVPFPANRYGEYVGYKTDHDPYARAISAGPLTSKFMTEALEKEAAQLGAPIFDGYLGIEILKEQERVCGLLCIEIESGNLVGFQCDNIIMATGGPAGIYADSVYPACHTGSSGLALSAGAKGQNLTEWQYGLASVNPRWNVSGTYMQVLPRFVSVDEEGREQEFLSEYFSDPYEALSAVFLKGYQWPFDSQKVMEGSSVIDLLVYRETVLKKKRVYLDYTQNPFGMEEICYEKLSQEAYEYLQKAEACFGKPIDRLAKMNRPAIELYRGKGLDIAKAYLEIALCAQHHNGGIAVDRWWQTSLTGLFAVGECAGTHGVTRPGGSALNAGQVGSLRAAQYISAQKKPLLTQEGFLSALNVAEQRHLNIIKQIKTNDSNVTDRLQAAQRRMSDCAAAIRDPIRMTTALKQVTKELSSLSEMVGVRDARSVFLYYRLADVLITQQAVLTAMIDYAETVGKTRGSALYFDSCGAVREGLEEIFRFTQEDGATRSKVQETVLTDGEFVSSWRSVRPIPTDDDFFENVWRGYRENKNID